MRIARLMRYMKTQYATAGAKKNRSASRIIHHSPSHAKARPAASSRLMARISDQNGQLPNTLPVYTNPSHGATAQVR